MHLPKKEKGRQKIIKKVVSKKPPKIITPPPELQEILRKVEESLAAPPPPPVNQQHQDDLTNMSLQKGDIKHLDSIISEFLKCYIIIGYDLTGKKTTISRITNQQDKDGLIEHLRTTFLNVIGNQGQGPTA